MFSGRGKTPLVVLPISDHPRTWSTLNSSSSNAKINKPFPSPHIITKNKLCLTLRWWKNSMWSFKRWFFSDVFPKIFLLLLLLHIRFWPPPCRHWASAYRFIRSIGLSDLPIIWFNLYPSRNRSGFLWYPTTWALICRHRASISSSSWDLPYGLYQSFMETEVGSSVIIIDNCSLVMSKDILILWSSSILETPSEYLTFILKIQTSDLSRNALKVAHCQAVQPTSNLE